MTEKRNQESSGSDTMKQKEKEEEK